MTLSFKIDNISSHIKGVAAALFFHIYHQRQFNIKTAMQQISSSKHEMLEDKKEMFDKLIIWEQGGLSEAETLALFQKLVDLGGPWRFHGPACRTASRLLREGKIQLH